jgi:hypothetical protein
MKISWAIFVAAVLLGGLAVLIVLLNIWDRRDRKKMTPEQRQQEDKELSLDESVW